MNGHPGQNPNQGYQQNAAQLGDTHHRAIAALNDQKTNIIHNAKMYVDYINMICAGIDQSIAGHTQALAALGHQIHGTRAPGNPAVPPQPQPAPAPQPAPIPAPVAAPVAAKEPDPKTEVVHSPPPNGAK